MAQMRFQFGQGAGQQYRNWSNRINQQPSWVARIAMLVVALVILIPILILIFAAMLAGIIVFAILSILNGIANLFGLGNKREAGPRQANDGRENVRVIIPDDQ